jgi:HYR domain-containing protein
MPTDAPLCPLSAIRRSRMWADRKRREAALKTSVPFRSDYSDSSSADSRPSADIVVSAVDVSGATATYTPPVAHDNVDASVAVTCAPPSGERFPLGATPVTGNASDSAHNAAAPVTFTVHVVDTTPPVLAPLANITMSASGSAAVVTFAPLGATRCATLSPEGEMSVAPRRC